METRIITNNRLYLTGGGRQTQMTFTYDNNYDYK